MYITSVFLKFGESIYVAMDLIPILLGSLPLAHNAQHSLVYEIFHLLVYNICICVCTDVFIRGPCTRYR